MARLTEEMVIARSKQSDFSAIKKLNCWGAELGDVSVLRRMPNVEVLALSINKIRSLGDFAACRRLRELYVRKNEIRDLREIRHLRRLPLLTSLWLDENPCTQHPEYRATVLRNLPNLEKLDNVPVHPEEVAEAQRRGSHIPDSDDEGYVQQETYAAYRRRRSSASSEHEPEPEPQPQPERDDPPERRAPRPAPPAPAVPAARELSSDSSEGADTLEQRHEQCPLSPTRRAAHSAAGGHSPECDERYDHPAMTRSQYEPRPTSGALPHSLSAQCVKDYSYSSNGDCRYGGVGATGTGVLGTTERGVVSPPHYHDAYYERGDRPESSTAAGPTRFEREWEGARERDREYPSAVMAEHRGFTRRPVARNSNLLSAVLCLVKELDYPSLEVAEMAVRCRMDELANSQ